MPQFIIGQKFKNNFENLSTIEIPSHLLSLKEIPMQTFIQGIHHIRKVKTETKSLWTFINVALIILFVITGAAIMLYIVKFRCKSSHSLCYRRAVDEHEAGITVLRLPTNDVVESKTTGDVDKSVTLNSGSGNTTLKDKKFLGQTDATMAWPKIGTESK